jgi:prolyl-tRNA editing enzyme YbaK/EbsC (Cys-tRNA(Pro) deacylase)
MPEPEAGLSRAARRVQEALDGKGVQLNVRELPQSTRTALDAADAIGCSVGQIAKSLVLIAGESHQPILAIVSGANRLDEQKLAGRLGEDVRMASADEVREVTGFAIGGVPPVGHAEALRTFIDADLLAFDAVWAAAGTPRAVFKLSPPELTRITGGEVVQIA